MKTSAAGKAMIDRFEANKLVAYLDRVASPPVWTIGRGMTGPGIFEGLTITQWQSDQMFDDRLASEFEPGVRIAIGTALSTTTQSQFDAMVSLAWNIGVGAFAKSTVARLHRAGDIVGASMAFALWNHAGGQINAGLTRRRKEEAALYLSGNPAPVPVPVPAPSSDYLFVLQAFMFASGDYSGDVDGLDGPRTRAAVAAIRARSAGAQDG